MRHIYTYSPQPLPGPGTGNYAFESDISLPLFTVNGAGTPYHGRLNAMQPPQLYFRQGQYVIGLAGNGTGQLSGTPLIDLQNWIAENNVDASAS